MGLDFDADAFFNPDYKPTRKTSTGSNFAKKDSVKKSLESDGKYELDSKTIEVNGVPITENNDGISVLGSTFDVESVRVALEVQQREELLYQQESQRKLLQEKCDVEMAKALQRQEFLNYGDDEIKSDRFSSYTKTHNSKRPVRYGHRGMTSSYGKLDRNNSLQYALPVSEYNFYNGDRRIINSAQMKALVEEEIGREVIQILAGFTVIKYGREGRPKQRKMWINSSLTHLAWEGSGQNKSQRGLALSEVRDVKVASKTNNIRKATKDANKIQLCFSLITVERTLDLQACSKIQRDTLADCIQRVLAFNKKYQPVKKGIHRIEINSH